MDILIVSGFLGAGKTTFIKTLSKKTGKEFAILENEYSDLGVDGERLQDSTINIWELTEGCICCSTKQDFAQSVLTIANTISPDYLVVEPTGVAKLGNIIKNLQRIEYEKIRLLSPICILDIEGIRSYGNEFPDIFKDQICSAGQVILSKTENLSERERASLIKEVKSIDPEAVVTDRHYSEYPTEWWDEILCTYPDGSKKIVQKTDDTSAMLDTFSLSEVKASGIGSFVCFMENIIRGEYGDIIRAKGNISTDSGNITFDVAGGRYALLLTESSEDSKAVFIGNRIRKQKIRKVLFENSKNVKILPFRAYKR